MIDRIRKAQDEDSGFTLIELLVVVIIIGILAAIAIPVFLNQRESAWNSAVQSDLRNAATAQETYFTDNAEYADSATVLQDHAGFNNSADITFDSVTLGDSEGNTGYCMQAHHVSDPETTTWYFDSAAGEPVDSDPGC